MKKLNKFDMLNLGDEMSNFIKAKIVESGYKMTDVVRILNERGREGSIQNLSQKLSRGSLRYDEAVEIADAIGYEIVWKKKEPQQ